MNVDTEILHSMIYRLSRNEWEQVHPSSWSEIEHMADDLTVLAAEISAYASARKVYGKDDLGHEKGLIAGEKARRNIRRVLGFTYP